MAWAREEFRLGKPDKDGTPLRAHLEAAGIDTPNEKPFPEVMAHIWGWFLDLHTARTCGMAANPITWEAIAAWTQVTGNRPAPWELNAIRELDLAYLGSV